MSFGFRELRLSPNEFWSMTLREIDAACTPLSGVGSIGEQMSRSNLSKLIERHPDRNERKTHGK